MLRHAALPRVGGRARPDGLRAQETSAHEDLWGWQRRARPVESPRSKRKTADEACPRCESAIAVRLQLNSNAAMQSTRCGSGGSQFMS